MSYTASRAFADAVSGTPVQSSQVVPAPIVQQTPIAPQTVQSTPVVPPPVKTLDQYEDLNRQLDILTPQTKKEMIFKQPNIPERESKTVLENIYIDKLYLQSSDCEQLFDPARMIFLVAHKHKKVPV
jgi:hypothetical protein